MAGKKDQAVVANIVGLTKTQAANIAGDIIKAKKKHTSDDAQGTIAITNINVLGKIISTNISKALEAVGVLGVGKDEKDVKKK